MKKIITNSSEETILLAESIAKHFKGGEVIFLSGDLGAGKTTFTKGIGRALGVKRVINSPTFTIVKEYNSDLTLYHMDLYRLENLNDFEIEEYFNDNSVCVCEWPKELDFVKEYLEINIFNIDEGSREFNLIPHGTKYETILGGL